MSSPATAFEKSLRSFQTGGLTYTDFFSDLKEMLAAGASAAELHQVLERRQAIEPMSESAYAEVNAVLGDVARAAAAEPALAEGLNPSVDSVVTTPEEPVMVKAVRNSAVTPLPGTRQRPSGRVPSAAGAGPQLFSIPSVPVESPDPGAVARAAELAAARGALEAAQDKIREITELARLRITEAHQEAERSRNESTTLRQALAQRDAELATLQREHTSITPALEARAGTLALELVVARNALEVEQRKGAETERLRDALAARDGVIAGRDAEIAARDAKLTAWDAERAAARASGDASLTALKEEHAKALRAHEARASSAAAELAAVHAALDDQQRKASESSADFEKRLGTIEAARADAEGALDAAEQQLRAADQQLRAAEHHQSEAKQSREALAERDRELVALRQEQTKTARLLDARAERATQLQADLTAARTRADTIEAEFKASQEAAARVVANLQRREAELDTARSELGAVKTQSNAYLESLRNHNWRQGYEHSRDAEAPPTVQVAAIESAPPPQPAAHPAAAPVPEKPLPAAVTLQCAAPAPSAMPGAGGMRRGALWVAALLVLTVVGWLIVRHRPATVAAAAPAAALTPGSVIQDCASCPILTVLPAGRFKQGSAPADAGYTSFEGPQHWVVLARPLAVSTNLVTVDQFSSFVEATGRDMQGCDVYDGGWKNRPDGSWKNPGFAQAGTHPVTCVSFNDATAYAQWLSAQTGRTYRLPSASEWEYAARAGGTAAQPWDTSADACANANVADASAAHRYPSWRVFACDDGFVNTSPVGSFKSNAFGLNDMLGNVFQWTQDCWNENYTGAPVDGSARSSGDCNVRELRGGSWFSSPKFVRPAYRNQFAADYRTSSVGIRLVREL